MDRLHTLEKETALRFIQEVDIADLWDHLLRLQVELIGPHDLEFFSGQDWWNNAHDILEVGCGNGDHIAFIAQHYDDKSFYGSDIDVNFIEIANSKHAKDNLNFSVNNIMETDSSLDHKFDVIIVRLVLQHLDEPIRALGKIARYLKPGGHVYIAETADSLHGSSHSTPYMDEVMKKLHLQQLAAGKGGRLISISILNDIGAEESELSQIYQVAFSNLETAATGEVVGDALVFDTPEEKARRFNQLLIFFRIANEVYDLSLNFDRVYDDLVTYLEDDGWSCLGWHRLVLSKNDS